MEQLDFKMRRPLRYLLELRLLKTLYTVHAYILQKTLHSDDENKFNLLQNCTL